MLAMMASGIDVEVHHHEVGTAGQTEIDMRFTTLTRMADQLMMYKYIVKNVCAQHGYTATFMPKPLFGDNGSGMHVHIDRKSTRLNSSHLVISYAVFCLKKKKK